VELIPRADLTVEQLRAVELSPDEHRVFLGGPGSGKTQVLLHRAAYLRDTYNVPTEKFRIFVFTRALKDYIRSASRLLDLPEKNISTLDAWCHEQYRRWISRTLPRNPDTDNTHFSRIRTELLQHLKSRLFGEPIYDFVMVDEGQDLSAEAFELISLVAEHVTVCVDHKQQIYEVGSSEDEILDRLGLRRRNLSLLSTFRCSPYIVDLASRLVEDPVQREEFIRQCRISQNGRETPLLYIAKDLEDEMDRLAEVLRTRLGMGERVGILTPRTRQMLGIAKGLSDRGFEVETKKVLDFTSSRPKVIPYPSAKGLTFDSVLMPRLTDKSFEKEDEERIERLLFVGITRAMKWVYMSSTDPHSLAPLDTLGEAEDAGSLEIQKAGQELLVPPGPAGEAVDPGGLLDLL